MIAVDEDRRENPRLALTRACKVMEPRSGKYIGGTTCNVGAGGVLLRLDRRLDLEAGDLLYVGITRKPRQGLLRSRDLFEAVVVRSLAVTTGETAVAVRFRDPTADLHLPVQRAA